MIMNGYNDHEQLYSDDETKSAGQYDIFLAFDFVNVPSAGRLIGYQRSRRDHGHQETTS